MNTSERTTFKITKKIAFVGILAVLLATYASPVVIQAQTSGGVQYTLLAPLPCISATDGCQTGTQVESVEFENYVQYVFNLFIALSAVSAVFMIVYGGFKYTTTDSYSDKIEGKTLILNAIKGLLLVLCSYLLLRTIDPRLVNIPSTIVKPLNISVTKNLTSNFFNQLASEAEKNRVDTQKTIQDLKQIEADVVSMKDERGRLQDDLKLLNTAGGLLSDSDPQVQLLKARIQNIDNSISQKENDAYLMVAKRDQDRTVFEYSPATGTGQQDFQRALTNLNFKYYNQAQYLNEHNGQPDQKQSLLNYKNYSEAMIKINGESAKVQDLVIEYDSLGLPSRVLAPVSGRLLELETRLAAQKAESYTAIKKIVSDYRILINDSTLVGQLNQKNLEAQRLIDEAQLKTLH